MIDGGKGQVHEAANVLEELQVSGVVLMGIAKGPTRKPGLETIIVWGKDLNIELAPDHVALHLIQFIRDEAHRFAIKTHRIQRGKARRQSPLESIEGIGMIRRQNLLKFFGGLQELQKASVQEIARVPGISEALAQKIYDVLHEKS
jgi:excinuclease ABC subunit C